MASGSASSVKLYATGLQRPGVLTVKIELMFACGPELKKPLESLEVHYWVDETLVQNLIAA